MSAARAVLLKDLLLLWRQRSGWLSAATFAAISVLIYSFAFDLATGDVRPLLPGVLWVTFLFAGIVASGRSFAAEAEQGTFDALLVAPVSRPVMTTFFSYWPQMSRALWSLPPSWLNPMCSSIIAPALKSELGSAYCALFSRTILGALPCMASNMP